MKQMTRQEFRDAITDYCKGNDFQLNPDAEFVEKIIDGVFLNLARKGYKYCPCRLTTGNPDRDVELICPCNFEMHKTWAEQGRCWCGLYFKKK